MIKVEMMQTDKGYSVAASGHADYAPKGQDIVCAAASVLLQTLANKVEEAARQKQLESSCVQHGESFVVQAKPSGGMTGIMVAAWYDFVEEGLSELAGQYPDHVELYIYDDSDGCDAPEKALNLQKFAEGGDGGAGAAEGGAAEAAAPAVQAPALRPAQERLARRSGALKGKAAGGEKLPQPPAGGSPLKEGASGSESDPAEAEKHQEPAKEPKTEKTPEERRRAFGEMVQGEYAPDGQAGRTAAVTLENVLTDDRKALAGMGSKVLIWPDKLAFDTETGQLETLGAKWELGDRKMTVCPCDTEGKMYEVAGAGDTEPESPEDGQLFLKGDPKNLYDYESVLEKWSAKSGKWVQVLVNTVRMTCPGIGSLLKEGDTVTLTGMPQAVCDALAADLNGEIVVQALEGDDLVASLTPAQDSSRYYGSWTVTATGTSWRSLDGARTENEGLAVSITLERRVPDLDFVTEQGNRVWGCSKKENTIYACRLGDPTNWYSYRGIAADSYAVSVGSDGTFTGAASCMGYVLFFKENCI